MPETRAKGSATNAEQAQAFAERLRPVLTELDGRRSKPWRVSWNVAACDCTWRQMDGGPGLDRSKRLAGHGLSSPARSNGFACRSRLKVRSRSARCGW